jgi:Tfp pilus assembly protein FimV
VAVALLLAVSLVVVAIAGAVAIGRGGLADLAPAPPASAAPAPSPGAIPAGAPAVAASEVVVVEPGDTLWSIARRLEPSGDVRPVVDRLVAANGSTVIVPGQELVVPG